ncbi:hypothetical protein CF319_g4571 [Tilletia indica]|nr:hypothetical protein CF319_g4571 [Tilletia indica]
MSSTLDEVSTTDIRSMWMHICPRRGGSRMNRPELVDALLNNMAERELSDLRIGARRRVDGDADWIHRRLPIIHRGMEDTYGLRIFRGYLLSQRRLQDDELRTFLEPLLQHTEEDHPIVGMEEDLEAPESNSETILTTDWPKPIPQQVKDDCLHDFRNAINIAVGPTCAACSRRTFTRDLLFTKEHLESVRVSTSSLDLELLRIDDEHILARPGNHFTFSDPSLNGLALDRQGIHYTDTSTMLDLCSKCHKCLTSDPPKLPKLSLRNGNIRGWLPPHLQDITWFEERLCAKYLASACVVRLYDLTSPGAPAERPRVMKGHACAFPLNTIATATKLPWAIGDGDAMVSCLVIGPREPRLSDLRHVFKVRRKKVKDLLDYLRANFKDYPQFPDDKDALEALPEDGVPEAIMRCVGHNPSKDPRAIFDTETTGIQAHPALDDVDDDEAANGQTFLEHHGLVDVNGASVSSGVRTANALAHATGTGRPDLLVKHGSAFIREYDNPGLFPGMFPTLFPWGIGGFEDARSETLSFDLQGSSLLDLADPSFRRHLTFVFVLCNIKQRRAIHLGSRLACKSRDFDKVSKIITSMDPQMVKDINRHLTDGGRQSDLTADERRIFKLLEKCEVVSRNVQGSKAVMNRARADIRAYVGQFGVFQLFLTLTPSTAHSPIFHIFYGDSSVKLDVRTPTLPSKSASSVRLADDPVAATDFFHFHIASVFKFLFGFDMRTNTSSAAGGILGKLQAYFLVKEHTMRGQLHGHILLWLDGGLNPSDLRTLMKDDVEFRDRYMAFFDDLIVHELPSAPVMPEDISSECDPRRQLPPDRSEPDYTTIFTADHHFIGELVQRHTCRATCHKGGRTTCRFLYPHEINPEPTFDPESNSISPRVRDPTINWHNPTLLVATRHNHDLKSVQSGRSGIAAASYITSYATKSDETPANQISMINTVYERMVATDETADNVKKLLSKCVMQFGRERQLHAQQVVTYVRDLGDAWQSHVTLPMLSGRMMLTAEGRYGRPSPESVSVDEIMVEDSDPSSLSPPQQPDEPSANIPLGTTHDDSDDDLDDDENGLLPLSDSGKAHQVDDYMLRGSTLSHLTFYEFVQFCKLVPLPKRLNKNHHRPLPSHPNWETKCHRYTPLAPLGIPRAIFSRLPRPNGTPTHGDAYCFAMLVHFKAFSDSAPLKAPDSTYEQTFVQHSFSGSSKRVMANWEALHECDDARDAEQLARRKRESSRNADKASDAEALVRDGQGADSATADVDVELLAHKRQKHSLLTAEYVHSLSKAGWFNVSKTNSQSMTTAEHSSPVFSVVRRRTWTKEIKAQEAFSRSSASIPKAATGVLSQNLELFEKDKDKEASTSTSPLILLDSEVLPQTVVLTTKDTAPPILIAELIKERNLNAAQALAFKIAASHFFAQQSGLRPEPLRMLMHGEGGTGKTVVVRLLRELLERYGKGDEILFMAPTGKAAAAIGGSTQHAAFSLHVHRKNATTDELGAAHHDDVTPKRIKFLENKLRNISWVFFDEVSMTSCETMSEIDQSLRIGKQNLESAFGGVNVMFAGDLCQLPPVGATPLYRPHPSKKISTDGKSKAALGRAVWKEIDSVVDFTQQMRMQDADMAQALSRLRLRKCNDSDAELLNSNVIQSACCPNGVDLKDRPEVIVLSRTNETVRTLNQHKAAVHATFSGSEVDYSCADDNTDSSMTVDQRTALLSYHGPPGSKTGLGRLPLFVGMPVVFRGGNQSVPLGVTNGAFATVGGYDLIEDDLGHKVARGLLLRFPRLADLRLTGLPQGCYPIIPTSSRFSFRDGVDEPVIRVTRKQLPVQPGFAMTVHSAQGITAENGVVVDLRKGGFEAYVAASRATKRANLFLFAPVQLKQLNSPPLPYDLSRELKRLSLIAEATRALHVDNGEEAQSTGSGDKRAATQDLSPSPKRPRPSGPRLPLSPVDVQNLTS